MAVISIHTAREGCDEQGLQQKMKVLAFQPTHPVRGATFCTKAQNSKEPISIHAPLTGCDRGLSYSSEVTLISIHAPLTGCDTSNSTSSTESTAFQSTHPVRGATPLTDVIFSISGISIHAPLTGCDNDNRIMMCRCDHFNPRTPHGVRLYKIPTMPLVTSISIHAPLTGCDFPSRISAITVS